MSRTPLPPFDTARPSCQTDSWSESALRLEAGTRPLPEYELVRKLGEGGFGQVWLARGPGGFEVALKFIRREEAASQTEMKALEAMKGIRHANLLALFGLWESEGWLIVAMELADRSLHDRLKEAKLQGQPGIPGPELLEYMRDAARGLDLLHERQIVHRDVKPHNLFLSGGSVKVADYGMAKVVDLTAAATQGVKGTLAYMAPEQISEQVTRSTDQYSLAATYCQLRGGRVPLSAENHLAYVRNILELPPDLTMLPEAERPIVARALAKDPDQRWPSCREFVEALAQVMKADSIAGNAPTEPLSVPTTPAVTPRQGLPVPPPLHQRGPIINKNWLILGFLGIMCLIGLGLLIMAGLLDSAPPPVTGPDEIMVNPSVAKPDANALGQRIIQLHEGMARTIKGGPVRHEGVRIREELLQIYVKEFNPPALDKFRALLERMSMSEVPQYKYLAKVASAIHLTWTGNLQASQDVLHTLVRQSQRDPRTRQRLVPAMQLFLQDSTPSFIRLLCETMERNRETVPFTPETEQLYQEAKRKLAEVGAEK